MKSGNKLKTKWRKRNDNKLRKERKPIKWVQQERNKQKKKETNKKQTNKKQTNKKRNKQKKKQTRNKQTNKQDDK